MPSKAEVAAYLSHLQASSANPRAASFVVPTIKQRQPRAVPESSKFKLKILEASEQQIQSAVLAFLRRHPRVAAAIRYNSGAFKLTGSYGQQDRWYRSNDAPGHSDIAGVLQGGRAFYFEIKKPGNKATPQQAAFLDRMSKAGALASVICSIDDVIQLFKGDKHGM